MIPILYTYIKPFRTIHSPEIELTCLINFMRAELDKMKESEPTSLIHNRLDRWGINIVDREILEIKLI